MPLTAKSVANAKRGRHADGKGLYLLVGPTGAKSWVLRVQVSGRRRDIGLGSVELRAGAAPVTDVPLMELKVLTLAEAREKAAALRKLAKSGLDPIAARDREKVAIPTFEAAAKKCHEVGPPSRWHKKHSDAFIASLKQHAFPKLGSSLVDSIDETSVVAVLAPLWHNRPAAARKVRQRIRTVLDFAKVKGWRTTGAPTISPRLALGKQPRASNFAAMHYDEVPAFVAELQDKPATPGRLALLLTILTAARSGEVRHAEWSQFDLEARTWTRPAAMMKSDKDHVVTLSPAALKILEKAKALRMATSELVFPGTRGQPLSDMTLLKVLKSQVGAFTVHGFRSAFRTWAAEKSPTTPEAVAEAALAHAVPDAVVRAYNRATFMDLRRGLLDRWGDYCSGHGANVVKLLRGA